MTIAFAVLACLCSTAALAQAGCKKDRPLSKPELAFYAKARSSTEALPAPHKGWEKHPEEISAPPRLCADADPLFKRGEARLNLVAETEYRDSADRSAKLEAANKAGQPTPEETKRSAELARRLARTDGGAPAALLLAEQQKLAQAQAARSNQAIHQAGLDGEARIRITFNPFGESNTGCGYQKSLAPLKVEGAAVAFAGGCDFSSNPQEPERGLLLLFGAWSQKVEGAAIEAIPRFDPKQPHSVIQAISVVITGDGARPDQLLQGIELKALAALVGSQGH